MESEHVYFNSRVLEGTRPGKFLFLSECGGFSRRGEGHVAPERKNYGYGERCRSEREMYGGMVLPSIPRGLCGCVYTQLSDVEGETNGLYTYDRAVRKVDQEALLDIAGQIRDALARAAENG